MKVARRLGAAPSPQGFGDRAAQAGARRTRGVILKMVRSAGLAPASPDWHSSILLLNDDREMWRGLSGPRRLRQKEQKPLPTRNLSPHPQENFTAVLSVFKAHLPMYWT